MDGHVTHAHMVILMPLIIHVLRFYHQTLQECIMILYLVLLSHAQMINAMVAKILIFLINMEIYMMKMFNVLFVYKVNLLIHQVYVPIQPILLYGVETHVQHVLTIIYHLD